MTHVSYNGYLQKVRAVLDFYQSKEYSQKVFVAYGKLVNPSGNYSLAPVVSLYHVPEFGFIAVK